jgi:hypothetical protein
MEIDTVWRSGEDGEDATAGAVSTGGDTSGREVGKDALSASFVAELYSTFLTKVTVCKDGG